jgi:DNA repair exonuclease SbcCD ATPase subunit
MLSKMPAQSPHDLYGLPLDRFIPERTALVKQLRGDKQRDEASAVGALRKPSVAAWAVNQLVRTQTKEIRALFLAGDDLVAAQADAAAGRRGGEAIRDASRRQREAVGGLVEAAEGLLSSNGHPLSQATLERVGDTLRAAAIDPDARRQVEDGCLAQELRFVGLGVGDALTAALPRAAAKSKAAEPPQAPEQLKAAKPKAAKPKGRKPAKEADGAARPADAAARAEAEAAARAEAEAERQRKTALKEARSAEADARRAATRADKELAAAQARRDEAAEALDEADRLLTAAEQNAERATTELQNAERAAAELAEA